MAILVRPAEALDADVLAELLLQDARARQDLDSGLWALKTNAGESVLKALKDSMEAENPPFRQQWLVAEDAGQIFGLTHSILLPVPPIYAGENGAPGLIMEDCHVAPDAPAGTHEALLLAAEDDLRAAGAKVLLGASVAGGSWGAVYGAQGYAPLTLYLGKTGLEQSAPSGATRTARETDVEPIVSLSAVNRRILKDLNVFWKPHAEADERFGSWMRRSLTLTDRDMFVSEGNSALEGYAISQPATPLHFPPAHEISGIGVIDDYYHHAFRDADALDEKDSRALDLFAAAEGALAARGNEGCIVVCPAAWTSKIALLEQAGYATAIVWYLKA